MRFPVFSASVGLLCPWAIGAFAQTSPPPAAATGVIAGIVLDAAGNSPIRRAIVTLSTVETQPQDAVAWTDANGRFSFGYLPAGRYQLRVTKDGYQLAVYGSETLRRPPGVIQLAAGQLRNDFIFHLQLMTSITGVVLDEDSEPLSNVQVMAVTPGFRNGKRMFLPGQSAMTDGSGHYRLSGLAPGRYAVSAISRNGLVLRIHPEARAGEPQPQYSYGVQYYPAADHAEAATLITVQPGQEISSIDFRLPARPATFIAGKIIVPANAGAVKDVSVTFMSQDLGNRMMMGVGASPPDYNFRSPLLPSGSYALVTQATIDGKRFRGVQNIELGLQGLRDIALPIEASIDLAGTVSVDGPDAGKYAASFVNLVPGDGIPGSSPLRAGVNQDGSFKIAGVPPGIWDINAGPIPPDGYIQSMRLGDQDVLTEEMMIRPSTTEPLKIVFRTRAATLDGDVLQGNQPVRAVVVLAPEAKFRHMVGFYRFATTDDKGHFEFKRARPGESRLFAFEEFDQKSIQDPDFLKPFEKYALPVTLREGSNDSQKLSVIPAGPPQGARP